MQSAAVKTGSLLVVPSSNQWVSKKAVEVPIISGGFFRRMRSPHRGFEKQRHFQTQQWYNTKRRTRNASGAARATSDVAAAQPDATPATHYDVLGVQWEASTDEVRAAYKAKKKELQGSPDAQQALQALEAAYDELGEDESRRLYDFNLANRKAAGEKFVWPYEVDLTQRMTPEMERNFKETADQALFAGFDNTLSDDEQFDLKSDLLILGVILSVIISAFVKLSGIGLNSMQAAGENAVEMWEKLGP